MPPADGGETQNERMLKKKRKPRLSPTLEDYLEAIHAEIRANRVARVRDIARALKVGMPAVTAALKTLGRRELVNYEPYQFVTLTDRGRAAAEEVSRRHGLLREFLREVLALDEAEAETNACRMEHAVDAKVVQRLSRLTSHARALRRAGEPWDRMFDDPPAEAEREKHST